MKKIFRILVLLMVIFAVGGCNKSIESVNDIEQNYISVKGKRDVVYNMYASLKQVNSVSFRGVVTVKGEEHKFDGKIINKGTIYNSVININYGDNSLYIKDEYVYVSYRYNGANIVVKDTFDNFINETIDSIERKGVKCNKQKIYDIIKNKTIEDVSLTGLVNFIEIKDNTYSIKYKELDVSLNNYYLPDRLSFETSDIKAYVDFGYDKVSINLPFTFDLFALSVNDVKKLLKVKNISDLIK